MRKQKIIRTLFGLSVLVLGMLMHQAVFAIGKMQITSTSSNQLGDMISDGEGGTIIGWSHASKKPNKRGTYVQKIDENGEVIWKTDGIKATKPYGWNNKMISDGDGGVIFINDQHADYYLVQRVKKDGKLVWGKYGRKIVHNQEEYSIFIKDIIADGNGGVYFFMNKYNNITNKDEGLYFQHIKAKGNLEFNFPGKKLTFDGGNFTKSSDNKYFNNYYADHYFLQKRDSKFNKIWGREIPSLDYDKENSLEIFADNSGGALVSIFTRFHSKDYTKYGYRYVWINHKGKLTTGKEAKIFVEPKAFGGSDQEIYEPFIIMDNQNNAIMLWSEKKNKKDFDVFAQKINKYGEKLWKKNVSNIKGIDELLLNDQSHFPNQNNKAVYSLIDNSVVIAWEKIGGSQNGISVQKIDSSGKLMWTRSFTQKEEISRPRNVQLASDTNGGVFVAWQEGFLLKFGGYNDGKIYSLHLDSKGKTL